MWFDGCLAPRKDYEGYCGFLEIADRKSILIRGWHQPEFPFRGPQFGHGAGFEELFALASCPAGPALGLFAAGAVGGDACAGVHLAVELGEEHEGYAGAEGWSASGALPDGGPVVEAVPDLLGALRSGHVGSYGHGAGSEPAACRAGGSRGGIA